MKERTLVSNSHLLDPQRTRNGKRQILESLSPTDSYRAGKSVEVEEPEVKEGETT